MADDDAEKRRMEKQTRKAEVLEILEIPKRNFLEAVEKYRNPSNGNTIQTSSAQNTELPMADADKGLVETTLFREARILEREPRFDISYYLRCTRLIYLCFTNNNSNAELSVGTSFNYILKHARLYGHQTQNMLQLDLSGSNRLPRLNPLAYSPLLRDTRYMKQVSDLISSLEKCYDETKYIMLNANVTYLTLLILQKHDQGNVPFFKVFEDVETSEDYIKNCPHSFNCELPKMSKHFSRQLYAMDLKEPVILAIYAYLTVKDDLSKTILRKTCVQYFEWKNMLLPGLFFKVVDLYGLEVAMLWDLLSSEKATDSLSKMARYFNSNHYSSSELSTPISQNCSNIFGTQAQPHRLLENIVAVS